MFTSQHNRQVHSESVHFNMKPFKCSAKDCNESFSQKGNLKSHFERSHEKKKRFPCDECDRSFYEKKDLVRHKITEHGNGKKFKCMICNTEKFEFALERYLKRHIKKYHTLKVKTPEKTPEIRDAESEYFQF